MRMFRQRNLNTQFNFRHAMTLRTRPMMRLNIPNILHERLYRSRFRPLIPGERRGFGGLAGRVARVGVRGVKGGVKGRWGRLGRTGVDGLGEGWGVERGVEIGVEGGE